MSKIGVQIQAFIVSRVLNSRNAVVLSVSKLETNYVELGGENVVKYDRR